jgi:outer membrane protein insertion porin family
LKYLEKKLLFLLMAVLFGYTTVSAAGEPFVVSDIRVEGTQRITPGTVFNYLPIKVGEQIDDERVSDALKALFKTGFFKDISIYREADNVLILVLKERPSIASVNISGNKDIPEEQLKQGLKGAGLAQGEILNRSTLDNVEQELRSQYFSRGKYSVTIDTQVKELESNRVDVSITIDEGDVAEVGDINIIGNAQFDDDTLLEEFEMSTSRDAFFWSSSDQYSKQRLSGDLERLRAFYMDRGYIHFAIESTQVSVTPEMDEIYVTINVTEGELYEVSKVALAGDLILPEEELRELISLEANKPYSLKQITETSARISDALGAKGYAFANVNGIPEIDEAEKKVAVTFFVDPGKRVYVNRINIRGNVKTKDEVLRREVRQMEGGWVDTGKIKRSRTRLERLSYLEGATVETPPVAGTSDQVDVNINVTERPSGSLNLSIGYADDVGLVYNAEVAENNFRGSGNRVDFAFNRSDVRETYKFSYLNPYYTLDGISRGFSLFRETTDTRDLSISNYETEATGATLNYGIPMSEFDRLSIGFGYTDTRLFVGGTPSSLVSEFIDEEGDAFDTLTTELAWTHDTRNKTIFATKGIYSRAGFEVATPGGTLEYYKARYEHRWHQELFAGFSLNTRARVAYGEGYGDLDKLPFFENFFAGGTRTVRGYRSSSLGPRDPDTDDPTGGNLQTVANLELVIPLGEDVKSTQLFAFVDGGNVYNTDVAKFDDSELRYSAGLGLAWLSPIGPLIFNLAEPLNDEPGDRIKRFQFTVGVPF